MRWIVGTVGLWTGSAAWAQDPTPIEPADDAPLGAAELVFNYDKVLLSTLQPLDEQSEGMASALFALLQARFAKNNDVVPMSAVPRFEPHNYGGEAYLQSCPAAQYSGCALLMGQRAGADWVVGATVEQEADEFEDDQTQTLMTVVFLDVRGAREVARFGLPVVGNDAPTIIDGIARVYDDIVQGEYELRDLRGDQGDPESLVELDSARQELVAQSLTELEDQLGGLIRSNVAEVEQVKVTRDDLAEYEQRDDAAPWDRVGMSQSEYLRYANSGRDLLTWRQLGYGRLGQILIRVGFGGGSGPFSQSYEGQLLQDGATLQTLQTVQYVEATNAVSGLAELELGFGVLPFLDLTGVLGARTGRAQVAFDHDVEGQVSVKRDPTTRPNNTTHFGVRATVVPGTWWSARPSLTGGLMWWSGSGVSEVPGFEPIDAPTQLMFEALPGIEATATPNLNLFARGLVGVPLGGTPVREQGTGPQRIPDPPTPSGDRGMSFGAEVGLIVRIGPFFKITDETKGAIQFEDDDF